MRQRAALRDARAELDRPLAEALLNTEIRIDFELSATGLDNHPQLHVRLQADDVAVPGSVSGYILYINDTNLSITRQLGGSFDSNWSEPLSSLLEAGPRYRLVFTVQGVLPVQLDGELQQHDGVAWITHTTIHIDDMDANRFVDPGTVGFSGADTLNIGNWTHDDFQRLDLTFESFGAWRARAPQARLVERFSSAGDNRCAQVLGFGRRGNLSLLWA